MTLVFVAKDMRVETPVGFVNLFRLPMLPSGLSRFHLTRSSIEQVSTNLVTETRAPFEERYLSDGTLTYNDTHIKTDRQGCGWVDETWPLPGEFTWMVVTDWSMVGATVELIFSSDHVNGTGSTHAMTLRAESGVRMGGAGGNTQVNMGTENLPDQPFMIFGRVDWGGEERGVRVPHREQGGNSSIDTSGTTPSSAGAALCMDASFPDAARDNRMYAVAQWDRGLTPAEIDTVYQTLKPWLAGVGVDIA